MLTNTTLSAIRALIFLGRSRKPVVPPSEMAHALQESPTYLAKIMRQLVKTGVLRAVKGARGGVQFGRAPGEISLLAIVEACQGVVVGDFCRHVSTPTAACAYHQAMAELHDAVTAALQRWTLADLIDRPRPSSRMAGSIDCRLRWEDAESVHGPVRAPRGRR